MARLCSQKYASYKFRIKGNDWCWKAASQVIWLERHRQSGSVSCIVDGMGRLRCRNNSSQVAAVFALWEAVDGQNPSCTFRPPAIFVVWCASNPWGCATPTRIFSYTPTGSWRSFADGFKFDPCLSCWPSSVTWESILSSFVLESRLFYCTPPALPAFWRHFVTRFRGK